MKNLKFVAIKRNKNKQVTEIYSKESNNPNLHSEQIYLIDIIYYTYTHTYILIHNSHTHAHIYIYSFCQPS